MDKPKKDSWPTETQIIKAMNAIRRIIPEKVPFAKISITDPASWTNKKLFLSELDEKKLKKLWKEYAKHYNIPLEN